MDMSLRRESLFACGPIRFVVLRSPSSQVCGSPGLRPVEQRWSTGGGVEEGGRSRRRSAAVGRLVVAANVLARVVVVVDAHGSAAGGGGER